jgi:hypothetical protein
VRTTRRRTAAAAIGACVLLLAVAACSSDDSTGDAPAQTEVETTVGGTDSPVSDTPSETTAAPSETTQAPTQDDTDGDEPAVTEPAVVVPDALQFTAPLVGGGTFDGAAVAGKPTAFWFWAPT